MIIFEPCAAALLWTCISYGGPMTLAKDFTIRAFIGAVSIYCLRPLLDYFQHNARHNKNPGAQCFYSWKCRTALAVFWYMAFEVNSLLQHPLFRFLAGITLLICACSAWDRFSKQNKRMWTSFRTVARKQRIEREQKAKERARTAAVDMLANRTVAIRSGVDG